MGLLNLINAKPRYRGPHYAGDYECGIQGYCYITVGVDLDKNLDTVYFVKIGKGQNPVDRCNKQRLKLIGYANNNAIHATVKLFGDDYTGRIITHRCLEDYLLVKAQGTYGTTALGYNPAGYTEMVGSFSSAKKAVIVAQEILDEIETLEDRKVFRWVENTNSWEPNWFSIPPEHPACST